MRSSGVRCFASVLAQDKSADAYLCFTVAFKVYDVDRDGFISNGELFIVLKMMVGNNLKVRIVPVLWVVLPAYSQIRPTGPATTANRGQDDHGGRFGRVGPLDIPQLSVSLR